MVNFPELSDVINNLVDLASQGHSEDVAWVMSALVQDIRARSAYDELEWILTSLRDTNLESTTCMVLATLLLTADYPSLKRKCLCDWYLAWIQANRTALAGDLLSTLISAQEIPSEHCPAPAPCGPVPSIEDGEASDCPTSHGRE